MQPPGGPSGDPYPVPTALQVNADASSSRMPHTAIDPTLLPLPDDDDNEDFPDFQSLLKQAAKPATKVAGSRRPSSKAQGKQCAVDEIAAGTQRSLEVAMPLERILTRRLQKRVTGVVFLVWPISVKRISKLQ